MAKKAQAEVKISATNQLKSGLKDALDELGGFGKAVEKLGKLTLGAGIGVALYKMGEAAQACIEKFTETEDAYLRMAKALNSADYKKAIDAIDKFSKQTKAGREELVNIVSTLATMGSTTEEIDKVVSAAIALSNVTGKDLNSSFEIMLDSLNGSTGEIEKYIPQVKDLTEEEKKLGGALDLVNEKFGDVATSITDGSFSQSVTNMKNIMTEIGETFGGLLLLSLSPAFEWAEGMLQSVSDKLKEIKEYYEEKNEEKEKRATIDELIGDIDINGMNKLSNDEIDTIVKTLMDAGISFDEFSKWMQSKIEIFEPQSNTSTMNGNRESLAYQPTFLSSTARGSAPGGMASFVEESPTFEAAYTIAAKLKAAADAEAERLANIQSIIDENATFKDDFKETMEKYAGVTDVSLFDSPEFISMVSKADEIMKSLETLGGTDNDLYKFLSKNLPFLKGQKEAAEEGFDKSVESFISGNASLLKASTGIQTKIDKVDYLLTNIDKDSKEYELLAEIKKGLEKQFKEAKDKEDPLTSVLTKFSSLSKGYTQFKNLETIDKNISEVEALLKNLDPNTDSQIKGFLEEILEELREDREETAKGPTLEDSFGDWRNLSPTLSALLDKETLEDKRSKFEGMDKSGLPFSDKVIKEITAELDKEDALIDKRLDELWGPVMQFGTQFSESFNLDETIKNLKDIREKVQAAYTLAKDTDQPQQTYLGEMLESINGKIDDGERAQKTKEYNDLAIDKIFLRLPSTDQIEHFFTGPFVNFFKGFFGDKQANGESGWWKTHWDSFAEKIVGGWNNFIDFSKGFWTDKNSDGSSGWWKDHWDGFVDLLKKGVDILGVAWDGLKGWVDGLLGKLDIMGPVMEFFSPGGWQDIIAGAFNKEFQAKFDEAVAPVKDVLVDIGTILADAFIPIFEALKPVMEVVATILASVVEPVLQLISPFLEMIAGMLKILHPIMVDIGIALEYVLAPVRFLGHLFEWVSDLIQVFGYNIGEFVDNIWHLWDAEWKSTPSFDLDKWYDDAFGSGLDERVDNLKKLKNPEKDKDGEVTPGTSTAVQNATYNGAMTVTVNIYQQAPVVGEGGMLQFAKMVEEAMLENTYYGN